MANYITYNNKTFNDIFKQIGVISSDSVGNTGLQFTVIPSDTNPLTIQSQNANDLIIKTTAGSTGMINILPNNVSSVSVGSTGIWINPNNVDNITMYNTSTRCFKQFNYGARRITISSNSTVTLNASDPRNIFLEASGGSSITGVTLTFPTSPPDGTTFRIIKVPATYTVTYAISLSGATFFDRLGNSITAFAVGNTVYECTYLLSENAWFCSSY